jgi:type II secretory pathway pseudopilin PulG
MVSRRRQRRAPARPAGRRGEAGYNLVMLMVLVTALNVLVAAALPTWTSIEQREREEELIFRGLQYAEGIRVFQARFGRLPVSLDELVKVRPRSVRQLWVDPMTGEADWGLIFASSGVGIPQPAPGAGQDLTGGSGLQPSGGEEGQRVTQGPVVGVFSRAEGESIKIFDGKDAYAEWQFTVDLLTRRLGGGPPTPPPGGEGPDGRPAPAPGQPGQPGQQLGGLFPPGGGPPDLSSRWIGRPWPPQIEAAMGGGGPGQQLQDGSGLDGDPDGDVFQ